MYALRKSRAGLMRPAIQCPRCGSDAFNNYGHARNGKQRFKCLMCDRQFVEGSRNREKAPRPVCPQCGGPVHVYMRYPDAIRYRCSGYPRCRGYVKVDKES
jgi:transposase-like protein